jgi:hypothetical protein
VNRESGLGKRALRHSRLPVPHSFFAALAVFVFFASFFTLFAQQSGKTEMVQLGQEFDLKINQETTIKSEGLAIAFESVLEDDRCPEDVNCIWAGNAKIKVRLSKEKQEPGVVDLNTGVKPKSSSYLDYEIKLVALKPNRRSDKDIQPNEYKATLSVTKK